MRILHTADWHLGARLGPHERLDDQRTALAGLERTAEDARPDLILHCGDVWDTFHPSHDALRAGLVALQRLAAVAPTVVVAGNHDSFKLLRALDEGLAHGPGPRRLRFVTAPRVLRVETAAGKAAVACVPFLTRAMARREGADGPPPDERREYAVAVARINTRLAAEASAVSGAAARVYAAHAYVAGCRPGKSERRVTVTDDYAADAEDVPELDYAAFGHIHDAQQVGRSPAARYAGALVRIGFDEAEPRKTTAIVEIVAGGARVETTANETGRPLVDFRGTMAELEALAAGGGLDGHLVKAVVLSDERVLDMAERLRAGSPKAAVVELLCRVGNDEAKAITDYEYTDVAEPPVGELFDEWRKTRGGEGRGADAAIGRLFAEALANAEAPGTSDFGIGALAAEFDQLRARLAAAPGGEGR